MKSLLLFLCVLVTSCSSNKTMDGSRAAVLSGKSNVQVSAKYDQDLSQERYHFIKVYFLNQSYEWERIRSFKIINVWSTPNFHMIAGDDLLAWKKSMLYDYSLKMSEAIKKKTAVPHEETKLKLQTLDVKDSLSNMKGGLALPARIQTEKWFLVQTPEKDNINSIDVELIFVDSSKAVLRLPVTGVSK